MLVLFFMFTTTVSMHITEQFSVHLGVVVQEEVESQDVIFLEEDTKSIQ